MLLKRYEPRRLTEHWWAALRFFYGRAFYQGRLDTVSERVYTAACDVLDPVFRGDSDGAARAGMEQRKWGKLQKQLREKIGKGKVGKARDVDMTLSALKYVGSLPRNNIIVFSLEQIREG